VSRLTPGHRDTSPGGSYGTLRSRGRRERRPHSGGVPARDSPCGSIHRPSCRALVRLFSRAASVGVLGHADPVPMSLPVCEPHAGPWQVAPVRELIRVILKAASAPTGRPRVVAIDGRSAAGKSTVAELLHDAVPFSAVVADAQTARRAGRSAGGNLAGRWQLPAASSHGPTRRPHLQRRDRAAAGRARARPRYSRPRDHRARRPPPAHGDR
jgi:hypothetical protein